MKTFVLSAATSLMLAGAAFAQGAAPGDEPLSSGAIEQLKELRPDLDITTLTPIQVNSINEEVEGDGLEDGELISILGEN